MICLPQLRGGVLSRDNDHPDASAMVQGMINADQVVPAGVYHLNETLTLTDGQRLRMSPLAQLFIEHTGTGVEANGVGVVIDGGILNGGIRLSDWCESIDHVGCWEHSYVGDTYSYGGVTHQYKLRDMWVDGARRYRSRYPAWTWPDVFEDNTMYPSYDALGVIGSYGDPATGCYNLTTKISYDTTTALLDCGDYEAFITENIPTGLVADNPLVGDLEVGFIGPGGNNYATLGDVSISDNKLWITGQTYLQEFAGDYDENRYWFENWPASLQVAGNEGTWCHDRINQRILYRPTDSERASGVGSFRSVVAICKTLLRAFGVTGSQSTIEVKNCTFRYGKHQFVDHGPITASTLTYHSSVMICEYVSEAHIDNVLFENLGHGLKLGWKQDINVDPGFNGITGHIKNCRFSHCASGAVYLGSYIEATSDYGCVNFSVEENIFENNCWVYPKAFQGAWAKRYKCTFKNNIVRYGPNKGFSFGSLGLSDGQDQGFECSGNEIHHLSTGANCDAGGFYIPAQNRRKSLDFVVSDNWFHHNDNTGGVYEWSMGLKPGLYLESSSSDVIVRDNLFTHSCGSSLFSSAYSRGNILSNNRMSYPSVWAYDTSYLAQLPYRTPAIPCRSNVILDRGTSASDLEERNETYVASHLAAYQLILTVIPSEGMEGPDEEQTMRLTFPAVPFGTGGGTGSGIFGYWLVGKFILFLTCGGSSNEVADIRQHWYRVVRYVLDGTNVVAVDVVDAEDEDVCTIGEAEYPYETDNPKESRAYGIGDLAFIMSARIEEDNTFIGSLTDPFLDKQAQFNAANDWLQTKLTAEGGSWRLRSSGHYEPDTPIPSSSTPRSNPVASVSVPTSKITNEDPDEDAETYLISVQSVGATVSASQANAIDTFVKSEKSSGRWALHRCFYLPIWGVNSANAIDLTGISYGWFYGTATHGDGYVQSIDESPWAFFESRFFPDYMEITNTSNSLWFLVLEQDAVSTLNFLGGGNNSSNQTMYLAGLSGSMRFCSCNSVTSEGLNSISPLSSANQLGVIVASRNTDGFVVVRTTTSGSTTLYERVDASGYGSVPTSLRFMCIPIMGAEYTFTGKLGGYGMSLGMDESQATEFSANIKTLWETTTGQTLP